MLLSFAVTLQNQSRNVLTAPRIFYSQPKRQFADGFHVRPASSATVIVCVSKVNDSVGMNCLERYNFRKGLYLYSVGTGERHRGRNYSLLLPWKSCRIISGTPKRF